MLPELPTRQYEWRHQQRYARARSSGSRPRRSPSHRRTRRMVRYAFVGIIDLALIGALLHPALVRGVVASFMTIMPSRI